MDGSDDETLEWSARIGRDRSCLAPTRSDVPTFLRVVQSVLAGGEGYLEVARGADPYPALALSAASSRAVVHRFRSSAESALLRGDGSLPPDELVELPIVEGCGTFSGDVVLTLERAVDALTAFARGTAPEELGAWDEL